MLLVQFFPLFFKKSVILNLPNLKLRKSDTVGVLIVPSDLIGGVPVNLNYLVTKLEHEASIRQRLSGPSWKMLC
jgi:hypothetical protein